MDVDGDGVVSSGDQAALAWWVASGGNLIELLMEANLVNGVFDVSASFAAPLAWEVPSPSDAVPPLSGHPGIQVSGGSQAPLSTASSTAGTGGGGEEEAGSLGPGYDADPDACVYEELVILPGGSLPTDPELIARVDASAVNPAPPLFNDIASAYAYAIAQGRPYIEVLPGDYGPTNLDLLTLNIDMFIYSTAGPQQTRILGLPAIFPTELPALRIENSPSQDVNLHIGVVTSETPTLPLAPNYTDWHGFTFTTDVPPLYGANVIIEDNTSFEADGVEFRGNIFSGCVGGVAGAVRISDSEAAFVLNDFVGNQSQIGAYAIEIEDSRVLLAKNWFRDNTPDGTDRGAVSGGAVRSFLSDLRVCSNVFSGNVATSGAGLYVEYGVDRDPIDGAVLAMGQLLVRTHVEGNTFASNLATVTTPPSPPATFVPRIGGGLAIVDGGTPLDSKGVPESNFLRVWSNEFWGNQAVGLQSGAGGGLYVEADLEKFWDTTVMNCSVLGNIIYDNAADSGGGGVHLACAPSSAPDPAKRMPFHNNTVSRNLSQSSQLVGAGVFLDQLSGVRSSVIGAHNIISGNLPALASDWHVELGSGPCPDGWTHNMIVGFMPPLGGGGSGCDLLVGGTANDSTMPVLEPAPDPPLLGFDPNSTDNVDVLIAQEVAVVLEEDVQGDPRIIEFPTTTPTPGLFANLDRGADEYLPLDLFTRGDANTDGSLNIADAIYTLDYLFGNPVPPPTCEDAVDSNDDGGLNIADAIRTLGYLFSGGPVLSDPFPGCGPDPTGDTLRTCVYPSSSCP